MNCCRKSKRPKREVTLEPRGVDMEMDSLPEGLDIFGEGSDSSDEDDPKRKQANSADLLETIQNGNFDEIKKKITPRALKDCEPNSLLMGMKVSFELRQLADKKGADEERFDELANTVEAFIYSLLDPLRSVRELREKFGVRVLDHIINDAIDLDQKKFFTHPAVEDEMKRKFHGRYEKSGCNWWQLLLLRFFCFWCALDLLFCPILFAVFSLLEKRRGENEENGNEEENEEVMPQVAVCSHSFSPREGVGAVNSRSAFTVKTLCQIYSTPYAKFVRDTVSYIVLVVLHYALCLSPSTIELSGLEWVILIFFVGRYLVERQQIWDIMQRMKKGKTNEGIGVQSKWILLKALSVYVSDPWNFLDFIILVVYLIILTLRVATLSISGSEMNNRALAIAGYFYSFNTLCLTLRVFGNITEQSRHLGVVQIALFGIIKDMTTIILQFVAGILAFSIAITKVYMAEKSFIASGNVGNENTCRSSGLSCWWMMVGHLGWSLLGLSGESDPLASVDDTSEHIARILYAAFIIFGVILLLNMLIALLSNTYQRTEENSFKVWSMKKAITVQTYEAYDPVPVPLNIVYSILKLLRIVERKHKNEIRSLSSKVIKELDDEYFTEYENLFPLTDKNKVDRVLHETEKNRQMVSQILSTTFQSQGDEEILRVGLESNWKVHPCIRREGLLFTHVDGKENHAGARHRRQFSAEFPHFEVVILETGEQRLLAVGVVDKQYRPTDMPGWEQESVGYHTDDGIIYHNSYNEKRTKGPVMARRGDRIRCTVMFKNERVEQGKKQVPVLFSLNGRKMITQIGEEREEGEFFLDSDKPLYPYICMTPRCSVLAKMCPREVEDLHSTFKRSSEETNRKLEELAKDVEKNKEDTNQKLEALLASLADIKKDLQNAKTSA